MAVFQVKNFHEVDVAHPSDCGTWVRCVLRHLEALPAYAALHSRSFLFIYHLHRARLPSCTSELAGPHVRLPQRLLAAGPCRLDSNHRFHHKGVDDDR